MDIKIKLLLALLVMEAVLVVYAINTPLNFYGVINSGNETLIDSIYFEKNPSVLDTVNDLIPENITGEGNLSIEAIRWLHEKKGNYPAMFSLDPIHLIKGFKKGSRGICQDFSIAYSYILESQDEKTRIVSLMTDVYWMKGTHVVTEIWKDGKWFLYDPYYGGKWEINGEDVSSLGVYSYGSENKTSFVCLLEDKDACSKPGLKHYQNIFYRKPNVFVDIYYNLPGFLKGNGFLGKIIKQYFKPELMHYVSKDSPPVYYSNFSRVFGLFVIPGIVIVLLMAVVLERMLKVEILKNI